jgi:hypothetical protein
MAENTQHMHHQAGHPHHEQQPPQNQYSPESLKKLGSNRKFIDTVKIFAIYGTLLSIAGFVLSIVISALSWSSYYHYGYYYGFNIFTLIPVIIGAAIGSAVVGVLFFFFYEPVRNWIKKVAFLSKYIHSLFTLFWIPLLVITLLDAIGELSQPFAFWGIGLTAIAIALVGHLVIYYVYSKVISAKLASHYSWQ